MKAINSWVDLITIYTLHEKKRHLHHETHYPAQRFHPTFTKKGHRLNVKSKYGGGMIIIVENFVQISEMELDKYIQTSRWTYKNARNCKTRKLDKQKTNDD